MSAGQEEGMGPDARASKRAIICENTQIIEANENERGTSGSEIEAAWVPEQHLAMHNRRADSIHSGQLACCILIDQFCNT